MLTSVLCAAIIQLKKLSETQVKHPKRNQNCLFYTTGFDALIGSAAVSYIRLSQDL